MYTSNWLELSTIFIVTSLNRSSGLCVSICVRINKVICGGKENNIFFFESYCVLIDVVLLYKFFVACIVQMWDLENIRRNDLKQYKTIENFFFFF
jgi:hypothetical protein